MRQFIQRCGAALCVCLVLNLGTGLMAQTDEPQVPEGAPPPASSDASTPLANEQAQLAEKYRRLEDLIFKMADFEAASNPRRATLLRQAYKQSKDRLTHTQLNAIAKLLSEQQYKRALDGQEIAQKDLKELLQLLMSEDRAERLKSESEKIKDYIKELKRLERIQRGLRGRTEAARDPRDLAKDQQQVADRTGDLAEQLESDEAEAQQQKENGETPGSDEPSESTPDQPKDEPDGQKEAGEEDQGAEEKPSDEQQPDEPTPAERESDGQPSDGSAEQQAKPQETQPGEPSDGQQGKPSEQEGQPTPPQPGSPQDSPDSQPPQDGEQGPPQEQEQPQEQDESPARKRVREAQQKMREARERLEEAKRTESLEKQTEALEKLQEAITELEEILRQMREEEMERVLALLEGRFRKMLEMELKVYEGTQNLSETPQEQRVRTDEIRASKLAFEQRKIVGEADRALTLLQEEGSSIAFPEVVQQMRDDMEEVAARLDQLKADTLTLGLEEEIISTLEELITALQKAQQDLEEGQQQPPGEPGAGGDPPLVDMLAELKMIRSLQLRVNTRTLRYARLLQDPEDPVGQAVEDDLRRALDKLSELEARIHRITRDLSLGKNQ